MENISLETKEYLEGKKFSDEYLFKIQDEIIRKDCKTRIEKVLEITKNQKVLHLGCCDHIPLIKNRINDNTWLHKLLTENCNEVLGLDINIEAIEYVKNEIGYSNLKYCDITSEEKDKDILNNQWDYLVMGEILEHVNNPVEFLEKIVKNYSKNIEKIIITVPNIICERRIQEFIERKAEGINTDHRYWFTPFTILKVAEMAKLKNFKLYFVDLYKIKKKGIEQLKLKLKRKIFGRNSEKYYFYNFGTLILEATLESREQRAESREQRAESREQRAVTKFNIFKSVNKEKFNQIKVA